VVLRPCDGADGVGVAVIATPSDLEAYGKVGKLCVCVLFVCTCVYMCVYMCVCLCMYTCVYTCLCIHVCFLCAHVSTCVFLRVCVYAHLFVDGTAALVINKYW